MANPVIEIKGLEVFYGDAQALWDVSLSVDQGAIVALVGANGAGKTTLISTLSGLVRPAGGEIFYRGAKLGRLKPEKVVAEGISHVPEGRRLFSQLTVLENLELGGFPKRCRPRLDESLERCFKLFPILKKRLHQPAGSLSGGEQQMLAIGRAIAARPTLLMLDEPSLGLAPLVTEEMFRIIQVLNAEGVSVLLVEQNVRQTLEIADYAYVLQNGRMTMQGLGRELLDSPDFQKAYMGIRG